MRIGERFREFYADPGLGTDLSTRWLPWLLDGAGPAGDPPVPLGDPVLTVAGGPATRLPADRAPTVLVADLADVDPTALDLPDAHVAAIVAMLALHHVPDTDAALAEWLRVLRPGGVLVGLNPIEGPHFHRLDVEGWCVPIDPMTWPARLGAAGYVDVRVRVWSLVGFVARRPGGAA